MKVLLLNAGGGSGRLVALFPDAAAGPRGVIAAGGSNAAGCVLPDLLGWQFHPPGDEWRRDVTADAVHPRSQQILDFHVSQGGGSTCNINAGSGDGTGYALGFPYAVVPESQPPVPLAYDPTYGLTTDTTEAPVPDDLPVEGVAFGGAVPSTFDFNDHHGLVLVRDDDPASPTYGGVKYVWELYSLKRVGPAWSLTRSAVRHPGVSAWNDRAEGAPGVDAGGTLLVGGLVRFPELARAAAAEGDLGHALRMDMHMLMGRLVPPARAAGGQYGRFSSPDSMPCGARVRLKGSFGVPNVNRANYPTFSETALAQARAILRTLQRFGAVMDDASGSGSFEVQGTMDSAWGANYPELRLVLAAIDAQHNLEVLAWQPGFTVVASPNPAAWGDDVTLTITPEATGWNVDPASPLAIAPGDYLDAGMTVPAGGTFTPYHAVFNNDSGPGPQTMVYTRNGTPGPRYVFGNQSAGTRYEPDPTRVDAS